MAERYLDLRGADRLELEDVAEGLLRGSWEASVRAAVEEIFEERELGTKRVAADVAEAVARALPARFPAEAFVDELGLLGWEILPPAQVREVRRRLGVYQSLQQSRLPEALKAVKMRAPRVKKLKGEGGRP
jgi:hypothetical protein